MGKNQILNETFTERIDDFTFDSQSYMLKGHTDCSTKSHEITAIETKCTNLRTFFFVYFWT